MLAHEESDETRVGPFESRRPIKEPLARGFGFEVYQSNQEPAPRAVVCEVGRGQEPFEPSRVRLHEYSLRMLQQPVRGFEPRQLSLEAPLGARFERRHQLVGSRVSSERVGQTLVAQTRPRESSELDGA